MTQHCNLRAAHRDALIGTTGRGMSARRAAVPAIATTLRPGDTVRWCRRHGGCRGATGTKEQNVRQMFGLVIK